MGMIGSGLKTFFLGTNEIERRRQLEALRAANRAAAGLFRPAPGAVRQAGVANAEGADITDAFGPVFEQGPSRQRSSAEIAAALAELQGNTLGFNSKPYADLATLGRPDLTNVNGVMVDKTDPRNANREIVDVEKGQQRLYDSNGRFMGVADANGYIQSLANRKEAEALAGEFGKITDVPDGQGGTRRMTGRQFMGAQGQDGLGYTPPAAKLSADKIKAEAQAGAQVAMPQDMATVDAALASIRSLAQNPAIMDRTGWKAKLPALPGTPGAGFDAQLKQLTGQVFLDAYASLRGAGAITEQEGKAATAAKARLESAQSEADFMAALNDLQASLVAGKDRIVQKAGGASQPSQAEIAAELRRRGLIR